MKPKKIAFYGLFGQQNLGNECTLQAIIYNIGKHFPDAEYSAICSVPEDTSVRYNIPAYPICESLPIERKFKSWLRQKNPLARVLRWIVIRIPSELLRLIKAFKILRGTDILIVPGTGFLTDAYSDSFGWPYDIFKWSLMAKFRRCKLLFVSVGAGPIYRSLSRYFIKSALSMADFRSYRDNSTMKYLQGMGSTTIGDRIYPDLAFSLPGAMIPHDNIVIRRHKCVVGIGLMSYAAKLSIEEPRGAIYLAYLESLVILVRWLLAHDYDVSLLIGDLQSDPPAIQQFRDLLKKHESTYNKARIIDEPALSVEHLLAQLASTDLVIATRFHNVVLALILNKPVIAISFHHKCASLMSEMGLAEYCQDINGLHSDDLIQQFITLEKNADKLRPHIKQKVGECCTALEDQYNLLFNNIITFKR